MGVFDRRVAATYVSITPDATSFIFKNVKSPRVDW